MVSGVRLLQFGLSTGQVKEQFSWEMSVSKACESQTHFYAVLVMNKDDVRKWLASSET